MHLQPPGVVVVCHGGLIRVLMEHFQLRWVWSPLPILGVVGTSNFTVIIIHFWFLVVCVAIFYDNLFTGRLGCDLTPRALRTTPNTAVSTFTVAMETEPKLKCVSVEAICIHDVSHLG